MLAPASRRFARTLAAAASLVLATQALALTYTPVSDADLFDQADAVFLGRVTGAAPVPGHELDATRYTMTVEQAFKGRAPDGAVGIRVPGAFDLSAAGAAIVPGAPRLNPAERVVVFLTARPGGDYAVTHLLLGLFRVRVAQSGADVVERDLGGAHALEDDATPSSSTAESRDFRAFLEWLRARAGRSTEPRTDGAGGSAGESGNGPAPKLATGRNPYARWFEFGEGHEVALYAGSQGQNGLLGGGYAQFVQALQAWNDDPDTTVRYVYAGTTTARGGLSSADGVNAILFEDPNGELAGSYDCLRGGLLGYAVFRSGGAGRYAGVTFSRIVEADIVIQDGAGCALAQNAGTNAAELFTHELGHTLGLGHSCDNSSCEPGTPQDDAVMRSRIHADWRGAALRDDDRGRLAAAYSATPVKSGSESDGGALGSGGLLLLALALLRAARASLLAIHSRAR